MAARSGLADPLHRPPRQATRLGQRESGHHWKRASGEEPRERARGAGVRSAPPAGARPRRRYAVDDESVLAISYTRPPSAPRAECRLGVSPERPQPRTVTSSVGEARRRSASVARRTCRRDGDVASRLDAGSILLLEHRRPDYPSRPALRAAPPSASASSPAGDEQASVPHRSGKCAGARKSSIDPGRAERMRDPG